MFNCCNMKTIYALGHGASVENFNTTRLFLAPKNRSTILKLFKNLSEKEKSDIDLFLQQANVILTVTNTIGKINIKAFEDYVKKAHCLWINPFGNYRKLKSSIHWSLGHIIQLLCINDSYSLAEKSENSLEATIKMYRYITTHSSRH